MVIVYIYMVGGFNLPLWKMMEWVRQLGWWHAQYDGKHQSHVPNHRPAIVFNKNPHSIAFVPHEKSPKKMSKGHRENEDQPMEFRENEDSPAENRENYEYMYIYSIILMECVVSNKSKYFFQPPNGKQDTSRLTVWPPTLDLLLQCPLQRPNGGAAWRSRHWRRLWGSGWWWKRNQWPWLRNRFVGGTYHIYPYIRPISLRLSSLCSLAFNDWSCDWLIFGVAVAVSVTVSPSVVNVDFVEAKASSVVHVA